MVVMMAAAKVTESRVSIESLMGWFPGLEKTSKRRWYAWNNIVETETLSFREVEWEACSNGNKPEIQHLGLTGTAQCVSNKP